MITLALFLELSSGVWTNVTADLIRDVPTWRRGINGSGPTDRIAAPGFATFSFDNTVQSSGGVADYYTPGHANCRAGFSEGVRVRIRISNGTSTRYVWAGRIRVITPDSIGTSGLRVTQITCEDKFADLAQTDVGDLDLVENATFDDLAQAIIDTLPEAPANTDFDGGVDSYAFAFDDLGGSSPKAMEVMQDVVLSELGALYGRGNATDGETWRLENRTARAAATVAATFTRAELSADADAIVVPSGLDGAYNDVTVQTVPRRADSAATTVLVAHSAPIEVPGGETVRVFLDYRDPANEAQFIGGKNVVTPVLTTDFTGNSAEDGSGADLGSAVSISAAKFGSRIMLDLTNAGTSTLYVRGPGSEKGLHVRGRGLYRYSAVSSQGRNTASIAAFGSRPLPQPLLMPYQDDQTVGQGVADYVAHVYGGRSAPTSIRPATESGGDVEALGITLDSGDRITLDDSITGVGDIDVFIQALEQHVSFEGRLFTRYTLAPADRSSALIFDDPVAGVLDANALGYL